MLNLISLRKGLSSILSPSRMHTAILFTPSGDLIAHATNNTSITKEQLRVLVGLATEIWCETSEDGISMAESELGKILIVPMQSQSSKRESRIGRHTSRSPSSSNTSPPPQPYPMFRMNNVDSDSSSSSPFLIALNATDDVEWAEMQMKARGVVNHFAEPLLEFGTRLVPPPPSPRTIPRMTDRFY
ncbi:hypothetical protein Clacol_009336 [Clathrus columnatus]|uniref:Roadblock/LAMTOR2 domain-containing protein n=1 Tax=Clathrus columnatus TaxID=1419009 RepID=A0AAV5AK70_9AGAM|nr:hypothetical protein Clacol_009336 [Clathrus columnatus]